MIIKTRKALERQARLDRHGSDVLSSLGVNFPRCNHRFDLRRYVPRVSFCDGVAGEYMCSHCGVIIVLRLDA